MSQPVDDGARELAAPFRMFSPNDDNQLFEMDFSPRVVRAQDVHPSEVDASPKEDSSPAPESATTSLETVAPTEPPVPVVKENGDEGEDSTPEGQASLSETSPGESEQPVETPPLPPAKTRSFRNEVK